ncbi:LOW QUALITY PROTEIN: immunoglobulin alpha Fc receptor [Lycaon pictus]
MGITDHGSAQMGRRSHLFITQNGEHQGTFILGPVNQSFSDYRCYDWHSGSPYVFSPSDALQLVVTDLMNQDYMMGNLIMSVAGLALLAILVENWHSHHAPNKENWPDFPELSQSKQEC